MARAQKEKKIKVAFYNPRTFAPISKSQKGREKPYLRIDDKPYGGGPGMVMQAMPILKAIDKAKKSIKNKKAKVGIIFLSPSGKQFDTEYAKKSVKKYTDLIIICGRYEGIDARIKKAFKMEEDSNGPFVLTGGELPAMIMIDSIARQVEGVLGNFSSLEESRISSSDVYTRPEVIEFKGKKYRVPKVLLSGHHKKIDGWRQKDKRV